MNQRIKNKLTLTISALLLIAGCSKHPTTVELNSEGMPSDIEVESTAYVFNNELANVADKDAQMAKLSYDINKVIDGELIAEFPMDNNDSQTYMAGLERVKSIVSNIPALAKKAQQEKVAIEKEKIAKIQTKIDQQHSLQTKLDDFTKQERFTLTQVETAIGVKQKALETHKVEIIQSINQLIVENRLPIKKLDESGSIPFSWNTREKYKGKCSNRRGNYLVKSTAHLTDCLYFYPDYKIRNSDHIEQIAKVINDNIKPYIEADWALKMSVGEKLGLYRKHKDAKKALQQAIIVAENHTDVNAGKVERKLKSLKREIAYAEQALAFVNKTPIQESDILLNNKEYAETINEMKSAITTIRGALIEEAINDGVLLAKSPIKGLEGELASGDGDFLMIHMEVSSGYRREKLDAFTDLNQEWQEKVVISENTAIYNSSSKFEDDSSALDYAISAYKKYQKKHGTKNKNS